MTIEEAINILKKYINYDNPDVPDFYTMEEACKVVIKALEQEPCEDCISREATVKRLCQIAEIMNKERDGLGSPYVMAALFIQDNKDEFPPVTPQPKMGQWISYNWNDNGIARWGIKCDQCYKEYRYGGEMGGTYKYCPFCGCKMQEAKE